jgi:hypothetical protein
MLLLARRGDERRQRDHRGDHTKEQGGPPRQDDGRMDTLSEFPGDAARDDRCPPWFPGRPASAPGQSSGGTLAEIGISSTVGTSLVHAAAAACLSASRPATRAASQPYPLATETTSRPGRSRPGTPGACSSMANDLRIAYSSFCRTDRRSRLPLAGDGDRRDAGRARRSPPALQALDRPVSSVHGHRARIGGDTE